MSAAVSKRGWLVALAACLLLAGCSRVPPGGPERAYYWNVGDKGSGSPATDEARIARLRALGVTEAHIWLNENRPTPACGYLFQYSEGGATLWKPARLEQFVRALAGAGIRPAFILSPDIRTSSYIASLSAPDGPLAVAGRLGGVDIELDIEGNGESATLCPGDGLSKDDADAALIAAIRTATPASRIIVSTTRKYAPRHPVLTAAADAISPQLYGAHYAYTAEQTKDGLAWFRAQFPSKPLWPALSVECSPADADKKVCSETIFHAQVKLVAEAWAAQPAQYPKYVVWGEREARRCPPKPLCSVFAEDYLTRPTARAATPIGKIALREPPPASGSDQTKR